MKKWILVIAVLFITVGCELDQGESNFIPAEVTKVIDGDTVKVMVNGQEETVRMLLIDTPETVHPTKSVQPYGSEASHFVKELLNGQTIQLEMDIGQRDKYGRLLAYVYLNDQMVNKLLLKKGLARVAYVFEPNTKYVDDFYEIQKQARQQAIGIWSMENYATDQGFNDESDKLQQSSNTKNGNRCSIKGNINSNGEKIYHMEESSSYHVTKPEEIFCTEEEAVAAGYRAVKR